MVDANLAPLNPGAPCPTPAEPSILIVDDDPGAIQVLARMLAGMGRLRFATSGEDALRMAREAAPDLLLLDDGLPGRSGFAVCQAMKADPVLVRVPVIFVTSRSDADFEVQALRLGAVDFIAKPPVAERVQARVRARLRDAAHLRRVCSDSDVLWIPAAAPTRVLIVDADAGAAKSAQATLAPLVTSVQQVSRSAEALRVMAAESINLVLLDAQMPDIDGYAVLQRMRAEAELRDVAVVFIGRPSDPGGEARALDLGADEYLTKPCAAEVLEARVRSVQRRQRQADAGRRARRERWLTLGAQRVADLVAELPVALVSLDATVRIVLINEAACRLLGVVDEQVIGTPAGLFLPQLDAVLDHPAPPDAEPRLIEAVRADGQPCALEVSLSHLGAGADRVTTLVLRAATGREGREGPQQPAINPDARAVP